MVHLPEIVLPAFLRERLAQGHPWVYRDHVPPNVRLPSGVWVAVRCGTWRGYALWDAEGPIALRIFSTRRPPDTIWLHDQLMRAWELRAPLRAAGITAYRWVFGEGDGLPGITIDRYGDFAVMQTYSPGARTLVDDVAAMLARVDPTLRGVALRGSAGARPATYEDHRDTAPDGESGARLRILHGEALPREVVITEHGIRFAVALYAAQKTGLFLDQRENRRFVEGLAAGRTVLNCFAYTGGFSLYALRGGARRVVSVDSGKGLAAATQNNLVLNNLDDGRHHFETADCFELLEQYAASGEALRSGDPRSAQFCSAQGESLCSPASICATQRAWYALRRSRRSAGNRQLHHPGRTGGVPRSAGSSRRYRRPTVADHPRGWSTARPSGASALS
jgi:23S rRNA (cytosine1962-C5)-methyltransferase